MALTPRIASTTSSIDSEGHVYLTINWEVQVTTDVTPGMDAWTVIQAVRAVSPAFFTVGAVSAANAFIQGIGPATARDDGDRQIWTCPVPYSTKPIGSTNGSGAGASNPLSPFTTPMAEPWKISGSYIRGETLTYLDKDDAFITLLGTEEIKAVNVPGGNDTLHMEGYTATIDLGLRAEAIFKTNSALMWGLEPRQLLLVAWQYDIRRYAGGQCVYHVLDWEINYGKWNDVFRNASFMKVNPTYNPTTDPIEKRLTSILGDDDLPIHEPHPIDEDGVPCDLASAPTITAEAIKEFDFLSLGFPATLPGPFV